MIKNPISSEEIRQNFLQFFKSKGHKIVPSSSLIPDDPSVLLTTAGMQQFKRYFTGELDPIKDFGSKNTVSIQKSFRTSDIDEVGDESHLTFFEMLGNFSFGGYFKREAIKYGAEFLKELNLGIEYVSYFGDLSEEDFKLGLEPDFETRDVWINEIGLQPAQVKAFKKDSNFWGPTGNEGPCGPTTEIFIKAGGKDVEVWNIVFNEYYCNPDKSLRKLETPGVDTGMGLERLAAVVQNMPTIFETDLFNFIMREFPDALPVRTRRIIADHIRAVVFLVSDGVRPSNKEAGYVLRRLMRRIIAFAYEENIGSPPQRLFKLVADMYREFPDYRNLDFSTIESVFQEEYQKFLKTLELGRKEFEKEANKIKAQKTYVIPRTFVFNLYQSAGITIDVLNDFAEKEGVEIDKKAFTEDMEYHKEISRAGREKKFGGHGLILDTGELKAKDEIELQKVIRLHTATHLLHQALRDVLGNEVRQMGSDITAERTRFDFAFNRKLTAVELEKIETLVNQKIKENLMVSFQEMSKAEAAKTGALHFFKEKYPERVKVYFIAPSGKGREAAYSKEFCNGPHVKEIREIGRFQIIKEEAVGAGVRRLRASVSP